MANKILIFDWDGVLIDSNELKWIGAWSEVLRNNSKLFGVITDVLDSPVGKEYNRYELLERAFNKLGFSGDKQELNNLIKQYANDFSDAVKNGEVKLGLISGTKELLERLNKDYSLYIITSTVQDDIDYITRKLNVKHLFKGVFGSPAKKFENFQKIKKVEGDNLEFCIIIGDGEGDYKLSQKIGCQFIGVANNWNNWQTDSQMSKLSLPNVLGIESKF